MTLPGDPVSERQVANYRLLNKIDQVENVALYSRDLSPTIRDRILETGDTIKRKVVGPEDTTSWEDALSQALDQSGVVTKTTIGDTEGQTILRELERHADLGHAPGAGSTGVPT
jgi:hypothetical protein